MEKRRGNCGRMVTDESVIVALFERGYGILFCKEWCSGMVMIDHGKDQTYCECRLNLCQHDCDDDDLPLSPHLHYTKPHRRTSSFATFRTSPNPDHDIFQPHNQSLHVPGISILSLLSNNRSANSLLARNIARSIVNADAGAARVRGYWSLAGCLGG